MDKRALMGELQDFSKDMEDLLGDEQEGVEDDASAEALRPSIPPMVSVGHVQEIEEEEPSERWTADVKEAAQQAIREVASLTPGRLFEVTSRVVHETFEKELQEDPDFFHVRYFVYSPLNMRSTMGPYHPAYDEPLDAVVWQDLFDLIWSETGNGSAPTDAPRGIHIVHEPREDGTAPFSLDISVDARGSIEQETTEVDLWWTISLPGGGGSDAISSRLAGTSIPVRAFGRAIGDIAELLGFAVSQESALVQMFHLLDPIRMARVRDHGIDPKKVNVARPLYEVDGRAEFRGRYLTVKLSDSSGFMLTRARDLHESSIRYKLPLTHFSLSLRDRTKTVILERRFET